jgi:hypothetical protein
MLSLVVFSIKKRGHTDDLKKIGYFDNTRSGFSLCSCSGALIPFFVVNTDDLYPVVGKMNHFIFKAWIFCDKVKVLLGFENL